MKFNLVATALLGAVFASEGSTQTMSLPVLMQADSVSLDRQTSAIEVSDAALTARGEFVVLDGNQSAVYILAANGRLVRTIGRRGRGPGEFAGPVSVGLDRQQRIVVVDAASRRQSSFSALGEFLSSFGIDHGQPLRGQETKQGSVLKVMTPSPNTISYLLIDALGKTRIVASHPATPGDPTQVSCAFCAWMVLQDGAVLVASPDTSYRMTILGRRGTPTQFGRRIGPSRRSREEMEEIRLASARLQARTGAQGGPRQSSVNPFRPRVYDLGEDASGRLWVLTWNEGETTRVFDLFSSTGAFLGTIRPSQNVSRFRLYGNQMLAWGEDDSGALWLRRFTIKP